MAPNTWLLSTFPAPKTVRYALVAKFKIVRCGLWSPVSWLQIQFWRSKLHYCSNIYFRTLLCFEGNWILIVGCKTRSASRVDILFSRKTRKNLKLELIFVILQKDAIACHICNDLVLGIYIWIDLYLQRIHPIGKGFIIERDFKAFCRSIEI